MSYYRFFSKKLTLCIIICIFLTLLPLPYFMIILVKGQFNMPDYLIKPLGIAFVNGLWVAVITCFFSVLWSVPTALLMFLYDFKYKKLWLSLLILPIAIPSYLNAYVYSHLLYYTSDFAMWYQGITKNLIPFNIRSNIGVGFVLSLSLYPYIFFPLWLRLGHFPPHIFDYARTVGHRKIAIIIKSILRSSMPVIIFGMALITLETLADYGTVSYYGVRTPSLFLFDIWQQTGDITIGVTITAFFLILTTFIFFASSWYQKYKTYNSTKNTGQFKPFKIKSTLNKWLGFLWFGFLCSISFLIPIVFFMYYFFLTPLPTQNLLITLSYNSFFPAVIAAILCVMIGFLFSFYQHHGRNRFLKSMITICCSGYAFPSIILGIAVYSSLLYLNRLFNFAFDTHISVISGSLVGLILCYYIKFLTVSYGGLLPVFKTINPSLLQSAVSMGYHNDTASRLVYTPFFKKPVIIVFVLVIVDIVKELPATLLLRPFGFETFATYTYNMAGLERIPEASSAALILIFMGVCATLFPIVTHIIRPNNI